MARYLATTTLKNIKFLKAGYKNVLFALFSWTHPKTIGEKKTPDVRRRKKKVDYIAVDQIAIKRGEKITC